MLRSCLEAPVKPTVESCPPRNVLAGASRSEHSSSNYSCDCRWYCCFWRSRATSTHWWPQNDEVYSMSWCCCCSNRSWGPLSSSWVHWRRRSKCTATAVSEAKTNKWGLSRGDRRTQLDLQELVRTTERPRRVRVRWAAARASSRGAAANSASPRAPPLHSRKSTKAHAAAGIAVCCETGGSHADHWPERASGPTPRRAHSPTALQTPPMSLTAEMRIRALLQNRQYNLEAKFYWNQQYINVIFVDIVLYKNQVRVLSGRRT